MELAGVTLNLLLALLLNLLDFLLQGISLGLESSLLGLDETSLQNLLFVYFPHQILCPFVKINLLLVFCTHLIENVSVPLVLQLVQENLSAALKHSCLHLFDLLDVVVHLIETPRQFLLVLLLNDIRGPNLHHSAVEVALKIADHIVLGL